MKSKIIILFFFVCLALQLTSAMDNKADTSKIQAKTIFKAAAFTSAYYTTSLLILNQTWYKGKSKVPFHFYNDNRGYLQVDKFGHMYGSYVYSYIGFNSLLKLGSSRKEALFFGSTLGFVLQFPIEIMDGKHEGYGFSPGDIAANTMGSVLVFGQELIFQDQVLKFKYSYWESEYAKNSHNLYGKTTMNRMLKDYNGHTYWFTLPIKKVIYCNGLPEWLSLAIGYGANGMYGEFENLTSYKGVSIPPTERYRQYLLSLDIDWTRIETRSKFLKVVFTGLTFVRLPFPALEYNSKGSFKGYLLYY